MQARDIGFHTLPESLESMEAEDADPEPGAPRPHKALQEVTVSSSHSSGSCSWDSCPAGVYHLPVL